MIKHVLLFLAALVALPGSTAAQDLEGTWALQIDDASIFVFLLERNEGGDWRGAWLRPERFRGNGVVFSQLRGAELVRTTDYSMQDDVLELRFAPTREEGSTDVLRFRLTGEHQAEMTYTGTDLAPYPLVRVVAGTQLGPFFDDRIYDRDNAAIEADYDPADEPAAQPLEPEPEPNPDPEPEPVMEPEPEPRSRLSDDFLDGLGAGASIPADVPPAGVEPLPALPETVSRACSDLDRDDLPSADALGEMWGADYEAIGSGLDIREYRMDNGDIARVTILGERIYVNSCGPVS